MREKILIGSTLAWVALLAPEIKIKAAAFEIVGVDLSAAESHRRVATQTYATSARRRRRTGSATTVSEKTAGLRQIAPSRSSQRSSLRTKFSKPILNQTVAAFLPVSGDSDDEQSYTLELLLGIGVGISLSAITACLWAGCCQSKFIGQPNAENTHSALSAPPGARSFAGDLVDLPPVYLPRSVLQTVQLVPRSKCYRP